jgi:large subunit ribosomal protein L24
MVICPKCSKKSRVGKRILEDGNRVRFCKKCDEQLDS